MEKKSNEMFVYTVYNKVSKKHVGLFYHYTDEEMIQKSLPIILMDYALRDIEIYRIAIFNDDCGIITGCTKNEPIDVNCYTFPHSRLSSVGDDLPISEIEKNMQEKKNSLIAKMSENQEIDNKKENK